jgi:hormone-sensitive lipase
MKHNAESAGVEIAFTITKAEDKFGIINEMIEMSVSNAAFYERDQSSVGVKLRGIFEKLIECLRKSVPVIKEIESFAGQYDFDESTPGNGYRSFVFIFEAAVRHAQKTCKYITDNRASLLFRKSSYMR